MSFELVDNLFQVVVLFGATVAATVLSVRRKERGCLILAFGYACFAMGTLFYVLYLAIMGTVPQVFYVSEISWPTCSSSPSRSCGRRCRTWGSSGQPPSVPWFWGSAS